MCLLHPLNGTGGRWLTQRTSDTSPPEEALYMQSHLERKHLGTRTLRCRPSWPPFPDLTLLPGVIKLVLKNNFKQTFEGTKAI